MFDRTLALAVALIGLGSLIVTYFALRRQLHQDRDERLDEQIQNALDRNELKRLRETYEPWKGAHERPDRPAGRVDDA